MKKGEYEEACKYYDAAIRRDPTMWPVYYSRASVLMKQKKWESAVQDLNTCIRLKPSFFLASIMRGWANERLGNYRSSLADYDKVLSLQPMTGSRGRALSSRAWLRAVCPDASFRNGKQAVSDAKGACSITSWKDSDYLDTLAAAYAEAGEFDAAVRYEEKAIALHKDPDGSKEEQQRLAMYRQRQPFRAVLK